VAARLASLLGQHGSRQSLGQAECQDCGKSSGNIKERQLARTQLLSLAATRFSKAMGRQEKM